ncbi:C-terminal motor kinesin [Trypanosoma theileri]|uniref:C-terminal motor kinesin n=1 Tax=Trypanosoma theileri TaxID=67003 RepID=A0A1X0NQX5_9TRYP|nr:C-terminal motor kinesin [Trypanosoma theileri]ORC87094.1 C-terminal motor kinesin [Trypanosoma theileri]
MQSHARKRPRQSDECSLSTRSNSCGSVPLPGKRSSLSTPNVPPAAFPLSSSSSSSSTHARTIPLTAADMVWAQKTAEVEKQLVQLAQLYTQKTQENEVVLDAIEEMIAAHEVELAAVVSDSDAHTRQHLNAMEELHQQEHACLTEKQQALEEMEILRQRHKELIQTREHVQEEIVVHSDALEQAYKALEVQSQKTAEEQAKLNAVLKKVHVMEDISYGLTGEVKEMVLEMERMRKEKEAAEHAAKESEVLRRQLYSQCEELKGTIRVYCRVKGGSGGMNSNQTCNDKNTLAGNNEMISLSDATREGSVSSRSTISSSTDFLHNRTLIPGGSKKGGLGGKKKGNQPLSQQQQQQQQHGRFAFPQAGEEIQRTLCLCQSRKNATSTGTQESRETFTYDRVFDGTSTQETVYAEVEPLVNCAIDGYRVCIFAYGQTGSGKTYSMEGDIADEKQCGITPRALRTIFRRQEELKADGWKYKLSCYFVEIYNDVIRDLQQDPSIYEPGGVAASQPNYHVIKHQNETGYTSVSGVAERRIHSFADFQRLYNAAMKNRSTCKTMLNDRSSRSHCIFVLRIEGENAELRQRSDGILCLVDLAGSERVNESGVQGQQFKEAVNINRSLLDLGKCITALNNSNSVAPWRNCKLTFLLQHYLGAKGGKMLMLVTVSDKEEHMAESLNSLRFASRVNQTVVGPSVRRVNNY